MRYPRIFMFRCFYLLLLAGMGVACSGDKTAPEEAPARATTIALPEPSRFSYRLLADGLDEPLQLEFDGQGYVYWIERGGGIKRVSETNGQVQELGTLAVAGDPAPGLIGFLLARDFEKSRMLYVYYSPAKAKGEEMHLSRFGLDADGKLQPGSEMVLFTLPWEQPDGRHFGGGMTWDADGNLYLSIGGDSEPTQYAPMAFTNPGGQGEDEARTAGNTNDLRGKILRIRPEPDGSYTIPEGNLFPGAHPKTRPEIYVMGNRNPWRLSIDSETGYLHWGEVGPDAGVDSEQYGPMGYDEFNVAREAGNFGWPFVIGKNLPYHQYDYASQRWGKPYDPKKLQNTSPNNTGLQELPPAQAALVAYPYKVSGEWPVLGSAARSAVGGPIFRRADFAADAPRVFPDYFEGKWLVTDYVRNWIMVFSLNGDRTAVTAIEPLLPQQQLLHKQPLDMDFGPAGDLYLVEYGTGGQGRLSRIEYNAGNRAPLAHAVAQPATGPVPLQLRLSAAGSMDHDRDQLTYHWVLTPAAGGQPQTFTEQNPQLTIQAPGRYKATLTVKDPAGATDQTTIELLAGNARPDVQLEVSRGNRSFYFPGKTIGYRVQVEDPEDGSLAAGGIAQQEIKVTAEYIPTGMHWQQLRDYQKKGMLGPEVVLRHLDAQTLISRYNCVSCHKLDSVLVGPPFRAVAERYRGDRQAYEKLSHSILEGSDGKWGSEIAMPPNPMLTHTETQQIVGYILDLAAQEQANQPLPTTGKFKTAGYPVKGDGGRLGSFFPLMHEPGAYVLYASYTDKGAPQTTGLQLRGEAVLLLRYPLLAPETADTLSEGGISFTPSTNDPGFIFTGKGGFIGFKDIDLTGINTIRIGAITRFWHWSHFIGATLELRLGSPTGKLVGEPYTRVPPADAGEGPYFGDAGGKPIPIDVSAIDGVHDVYIVVRNAKAKESDALLIMTGIGFEQ